MEITVERNDDRSVVGVSGPVGPPNTAELSSTLLKAAAEQPEAVVCDLTGATADRFAIPMFLRVSDELRAWPSSPLVLVAPDADLRLALERLGVPRRLPVVRSRAQVRDAL